MYTQNNFKQKKDESGILNDKLDNKKKELNKKKALYESSTMKGLHARQKIAAVNSDALLEYYGKTNVNVEILSKKIFDSIVKFQI